jgi:adenosine kinase
MVALNDYEAKVLVERTGLSIETLAGKIRALIVTRGSEGSQIHADGKVLEIGAAHASGVADPTGCGDAYRAGLLFGIDQGMDWETTGRLAAVMGAFKIECAGAQNHAPDRDAIADRFLKSFGYRPW